MPPIIPDEKDGYDILRNSIEQIYLRLDEMDSKIRQLQQVNTNQPVRPNPPVQGRPNQRGPTPKMIDTYTRFLGHPPPPDASYDYVFKAIGESMQRGRKPAATPVGV